MMPLGDVSVVGLQHAVQDYSSPLDTERGSHRQNARRHLRQGLLTKSIKGFEERFLTATLQIWKGTGDDWVSFSRARHDPGLVQSTTRAKNDGFDKIEPYPERQRPEIPWSPDCTVSIDVSNNSAEADADTPDPPFYDFGSSITPIFDETEAIKSGGSSQVFRVKIQVSHIVDNDGEGTRNAVFAVKKIYSQSSGDFARERDAYRRMSFAQNPHPHIVPLLATYRMEGKYHFVFPSANSDLAMFWQNQPRPSIDKRTLEWFGGQMKGLADALYTIHGENGQERKLRGIHGDLKPENILCFGSNDSERWPVLAITDFGSSYFLTPEEKDIPKGLKHTPAYRAPEIDTTVLGGITQAYDVWSLGCIFAEAIAWVYGGKAGITKLIRARVDDEDKSPNRDAFFQLQYDKRGGLKAKLKPGVHRVFLLRTIHLRI